MPDASTDTRAAEGSVFWWWDDAVVEAHRRATLTRQRMSVRPIGGLWRVAPATDPRRFVAPVYGRPADRYTTGGPR